MHYFSYNDYIDYAQGGEVDRKIQIEEKKEDYRRNNGKIANKEKNNKRLCLKNNPKNVQKTIIGALRDKNRLRKFLIMFFKRSKIIEIDKVTYSNDYMKSGNCKNILVCKINNKEIYIFIKIFDEINYNMVFEIFENCMEIIRLWNLKEKEKNRRHPIVIPIVIYVGKKDLNKEKIINKKVKYLKYANNRIDFSYNFIELSKITQKQKECLNLI